MFVYLHKIVQGVRGSLSIIRLVYCFFWGGGDLVMLWGHICRKCSVMMLSSI